MKCQVDVAGDGAAAVRGAETNSYDIVLMDLGMPGVDGLEAARRIRHLSGVPSSIPIVALTASVADEVRAQCLEAGMNDFLSKPIEAQALRRVLDRWCHCGASTVALVPEVSEPA
jgi:CheY-like chemotaxis protein